MKLLKYLLFVSLFLVYMNCKPVKSNSSELLIKEGIAGRVLWREGDFMPMINNSNKNRNKSVGVSREIHIYSLTNLNQTTQKGNFFTDIKSHLITKVISDANGVFRVALDPGTYSLFTKEEEGYFANIYDGENNIFPVIVEPGKITELTIIVDYKATY